MKLSLPNVSIGFWETFEYFEVYPIFTYLVGHFCDFFRKISVFGQIGSMEYFSIQFWPMNLDFHPELIKCKKHRIFQNFRFRP